MAKAKIRVIHCGTGPAGRVGLRGIVNHPDLELVGHLVFDAEKDEKDSGVLCEIGREVGIKATTNIDDLIALKADYFVYLGDGLGKLQNSVAVVARFLETGTNVGTAALFATSHPPTSPPDIRERIEQACRTGKTSYYYSGIDPGFAGYWLAAALLKGCDEVTLIRMQEMANYGIYPVEWVMREVFGFGKPKGHACALSDGSFISLAWNGTVNAVADRMGIRLDSTRTFYESDDTFPRHDTLWGPVEAGTVSALRFGVEGIYKGKPFIVLEHITRTHADAAPHWPMPLFGPGKDLRHQHALLIEGNPSHALRWDLGLTRDGDSAGMVFTAMLIVNAAESILHHGPGIVNEMDLPLYTARNIVV